jgi:hypothetical protein
VLVALVLAAPPALVDPEVVAPAPPAELVALALVDDVASEVVEATLLDGMGPPSLPACPSTS